MQHAVAFQHVVDFGPAVRPPVPVPDGVREGIQLPADFPRDERLEDRPPRRRRQQRLRRGNPQQVRLDAGIGENPLGLAADAFDGVALPRGQFVPLERRLQQPQPPVRRRRRHPDFPPELRMVDFLRRQRRRQREEPRKRFQVADAPRHPHIPLQIRPHVGRRMALDEPQRQRRLLRQRPPPQRLHQPPSRTRPLRHGVFPAPAPLQEPHQPRLRPASRQPQALRHRTRLQLVHQNPSRQAFRHPLQQQRILRPAQQIAPLPIPRVQPPLQGREQLRCVLHLVQDGRRPQRLQEQVRIAPRPHHVHHRIERHQLDARKQMLQQRGLPHLPRPDEQNRLRDRKPLPYFVFQMPGKILHDQVLLSKVACIICIRILICKLLLPPRCPCATTAPAPRRTPGPGNPAPARRPPRVPPACGSRWRASRRGAPLRRPPARPR